jgi:hypothetical protein
MKTMLLLNLRERIERKSEREKEGGPEENPDDGVWVLGWGYLLSLVYISSFRVGGYRCLLRQHNQTDDWFKSYFFELSVGLALRYCTVSWLACAGVPPITASKEAAMSRFTASPLNFLPLQMSQHKLKGQIFPSNVRIIIWRCVRSLVHKTCRINLVYLGMF